MRVSTAKMASRCDLNIFVNDENGTTTGHGRCRLRVGRLNDPPRLRPSHGIRFPEAMQGEMVWDQAGGQLLHELSAVDRSTPTAAWRIDLPAWTATDTNYYFVLVDDSGVSPRYRFRTAADTPKPLTFIVGGDSCNNRTRGKRPIAWWPSFVPCSFRSPVT